MSFAKFKRLIDEGDTVILYVGLSQIYAIEVKPTVKNRHGIMVEYTFQTKYGALRVMDLVGKEFGSKVQLTKGYAFALYPTPELWTLTLPHRTQILYTPDISLIITQLEIRSGSIVCEAGTGSGSLSHAILRTIGPTGHLYTSDFHQERVEVVRDEFYRHGHASRVTVEARDVCENGWGKKNVANAVFLDLPKPWDALSFAVEAIQESGGRICSFSPCVEQVSRSCEVMRRLNLTEINTIECLQREFQFRSLVLPPVDLQQIDEAQVDQKRTLESNCEASSKRVKLENESDLPQKVEENDNKMEVDCNSSEGNDKQDAVKVKEGEKENNEVINLELENEKETKSTVDAVVSNTLSEKTSSNCYKIRTAIPLLKMQGHTGFLTFATVPPKRKKRLDSSSKVSDIIKSPMHTLEPDHNASIISEETTTDLTNSLSCVKPISKLVPSTPDASQSAKLQNKSTSLEICSDRQ